MTLERGREKAPGISLICRPSPGVSSCCAWPPPAGASGRSRADRAFGRLPQWRERSAALRRRAVRWPRPVFPAETRRNPCPRRCSPLHRGPRPARRRLTRPSHLPTRRGQRLKQRRCRRPSGPRSGEGRSLGSMPRHDRWVAPVQLARREHESLVVRADRFLVGAVEEGQVACQVAGSCPKLDRRALRLRDRLDHLPRALERGRGAARAPPP